jgi:hypothetical protein
MTGLLPDLLYAGRPDEWLWVIVVGIDELCDGCDQLRNAREAAASNTFVGEVAKPALDQI